MGQMICVGQQAQISTYSLGFTDRTLIIFFKFDDGASARGFSSLNSFIHQVYHKTEFFFNLYFWS